MLLNSPVCFFFFPPQSQLHEGGLSLQVDANRIWGGDEGWLRPNKAVIAVCGTAVAFGNRKGGCRCGSCTYKKTNVWKNGKIEKVTANTNSHMDGSATECSGGNISNMLSSRLQGLSCSGERLPVCLVMQRASAHSKFSCCVSASSLGQDCCLYISKGKCRGTNEVQLAFYCMLSVGKHHHYATRLRT